MAFVRTIFIYKRKVPLSICSLPVAIIKSYTNNIYNRLWRLKGLQLENEDWLEQYLYIKGKPQSIHTIDCNHKQTKYQSHIQ